MSGSLATVMPVARVSRAPVETLVAPVLALRAAGERISSVPAATLIGPLSELAPLRLSLPAPVFTTPPEPVKLPVKVVSVALPVVRVPAPRETVPDPLTLAMV